MMTRDRWVVTAFATVGALCIGGVSGVALGQFTIAGIDPDRSALYAASPPAAIASSDPVGEGGLYGDIAEAVPVAHRIAHEAGLPSSAIDAQYEDAAFDDRGRRLSIN